MLNEKCDDHEKIGVRVSVARNAFGKMKAHLTKVEHTIRTPSDGRTLLHMADIVWSGIMIIKRQINEPTRSM